MLRYMQGDGAFSDHLAPLGPELGPLFHELCGEFVLLNEKWRVYADLFGASPRRVDLLERAASRFFAFLQPTLFDDTAIHLVRLTADPNAEKHSFLTIRRLPEFIREASLRMELEEDIALATNRTEFARNWLRWRRESLSHRAIPPVLSADTLHLASRHQDVEEALGAVARVLNRVHWHFFRGELVFDSFGAPGDAMDLLHVLNIGVSARGADVG